MYLRMISFCRKAFFLMCICQTNFETTGFAQIVHKSIQVACGDAMIDFAQTSVGKKNAIQWVHVHKNEITAVEAMQSILNNGYNGHFVTLDHKGDRYLRFAKKQKMFVADPNRIFSTKGAKATLQSNGAYTKQALAEIEQLSKVFLDSFVIGKQFIVALHNNSDEGGLHINSYLASGVYEKEAAKVFVQPDADADDFFYTTDERIFTALKNKGFNILLQNNNEVTDDGSLSVFCGKYGIAYVNIEAQMGHLEEQKRMIKAVYEVIASLGL